MAANPIGPLELAMTQFADGRACLRPPETREIAQRMLRWTTTPEHCQSCQSNQARSIVCVEALCATCRQQRAARVERFERLDTVLARRSYVESENRLQGHAIVVDKPSLDLGGFVEIIRPSALNRTLNEAIDVRSLWNHNSDSPMGRLSAGTLAIRKDRFGLATQIEPPSWAGSQMESVERGDVTGMSFGFRAIEDEWTFDGPIPLREVFDMRVSEVSPVTFPAYPDTDLRVNRGKRNVDWLQKIHRTRLAR